MKRELNNMLHHLQLYCHKALSCKNPYDLHLLIGIIPTGKIDWNTIESITIVISIFAKLSQKQWLGKLYLAIGGEEGRISIIANTNKLTSTQGGHGSKNDRAKVF